MAGPILSGIGSLLAGAGGQNGANPLISSMLDGLLQKLGENPETKQNAREQNSGGIDFETMLNMASLFTGDNNNAEGLMGFLPMLMQNFAGGSGEEISGTKKHDHSGHSWFLPPILENIHIMWEHFR